MRTIHVHLDDTLNNEQLASLQQSLMSIPHIKDVSMSPRAPHDFLVDFEETYNTPVTMLHELHLQGLHPDIVSC